MFHNNFEKPFDDFQQQREYDQAENALLPMVRIAFIARWLSAGGDPPQEQKIFTLVHKQDIPMDSIGAELTTK